MSMNVKQISTLALMEAPVLIYMELTNVYVLKDGVDPSVTMVSPSQIYLPMIYIAIRFVCCMQCSGIEP